MDLSCEELLILLALYQRQKRRKNTKRFWVRRIFAERQEKGEYNNLVRETRLHDHEFFFKLFRMTPSQLEKLTEWVAPLIVKDSSHREAISPEERLCVTLRHLASGDSHVSLAASYRISQTTIGRLIPETCDALWDVLTREGFMNVPKTADEWKVVASEMEYTWNFPNCLGAMDGKHINIVAPARSGSLFFNYKKTFSIVLLAICNANYEFLMVDIGEAGRQSDAGVFANSNLGHSITNNLLPVPEPRILSGTTSKFPYVFVADDAFPLRLNIIKPYSESKMEINKIIANYRISRARRVIENAFGILTARFRIFSRPINATVEHIESCTKASVALHNYLMCGRKLENNQYCPEGFVDIDGTSRQRQGDWRKIVESDTGLGPVVRIGSNNYSKEAKRVRDLFCEYFNSPAGQVPWQWEIIHANSR